MNNHIHGVTGHAYKLMVHYTVQPTCAADRDSVKYRSTCFNTGLSFQVDPHRQYPTSDAFIILCSCSHLHRQRIPLRAWLLSPLIPRQHISLNRNNGVCTDPFLPLSIQGIEYKPEGRGLYTPWRRVDEGRSRGGCDTAFMKGSCDCCVIAHSHSITISLDSMSSTHPACETVALILPFLIHGHIYTEMPSTASGDSDLEEGLVDGDDSGSL